MKVTISIQGIGNQLSSTDIKLELFKVGPFPRSMTAGEGFLLAFNVKAEYSIRI